MPVDLPETYLARRAALVAQYRAIPAGAPVRLAKRTSNLFRPRARAGVAGLDVSGFDGVLSVDPVARTAQVQGMTTYEHLLDATLPYGLMPLVVPQLKTITLGGAVTGLGIESSSFRNGMPHESVLELEILTGDGRVVVARPDNEHAELFGAFPNSYGTLGYALRLVIELEPVKPYVRLEHRKFDSPEALVAALPEVCRLPGDEDRDASEGTHDFVDATAFSPSELYLTVASFTDRAPYLSDYTGEDIYYRSIQRRSEDFLTVGDYLWRWDTDWFWCSRAFGVQNPRVRRVLPKGLLRSDNYWKIVALENRLHVAATIDRWRGRPARESVVQDIPVPVERAAQFLRFLDEETGIRPVWMCPVRAREDASGRAGEWPLWPMRPGQLYLNFGFWSSVPLAPGEDDGTHNRRIEQMAERLGGVKSLYSTVFYDRDRFWQFYNGQAYAAVKKAYDPAGRLLDLYDKCVRRR